MKIFGGSAGILPAGNQCYPRDPHFHGSSQLSAESDDALRLATPAILVQNPPSGCKNNQDADHKDISHDIHIIAPYLYENGHQGLSSLFIHWLWW
jgi:hypothetical protein